MTFKLRRKDWVVFAALLLLQAPGVWFGMGHPVAQAGGSHVHLGPLEVTILSPAGWLIFAWWVVAGAFLTTSIITRLLDVVNPNWPHAPAPQGRNLR